MSFFDFISTYWPRLLSGTGITVAQFFLSAFFAILLSLTFGLMKMSNNLAVKGFAVTYIEVFRGTSLLVQLYWIFFVLPLFGLTLEKFTAGYVAIAMNTGAYGAELVRGGIMAVPKGQWEAATAINMSPAKRMWRIILPQALVNMLPPWGNLMIEVLKGTALVSLISGHGPDVPGETDQRKHLSVGANLWHALIIYYLLARFLLLTPFMRWLEGYMARKLARV